MTSISISTNAYNASSTSLLSSQTIPNKVMITTETDADLIQNLFDLLRKVIRVVE